MQGAGIEPRIRVWFNPRLESRDFMIPGIVAPTPLAAFVRYLEGSASRADLEARWEALMSGRHR